MQKGKLPVMVEPEIILYKEGSTIIKPTDHCFIQCTATECFPEHQFALRAEKIHVCVHVENLGIINWD